MSKTRDVPIFKSTAGRVICVADQPPDEYYAQESWSPRHRSHSSTDLKAYLPAIPKLTCSKQSPPSGPSSFRSAPYRSFSSSSTSLSLSSLSPRSSGSCESLSRRFVGAVRSKRLPNVPDALRTLVMPRVPPEPDFEIVTPVTPDWVVPFPTYNEPTHRCTNSDSLILPIPASLKTSGVVGEARQRSVSCSSPALLSFIMSRRRSRRPTESLSSSPSPLLKATSRQISSLTSHQKSPSVASAPDTPRYSYLDRDLPPLPPPSPCQPDAKDKVA